MTHSGRPLAHHTTAHRNGSRRAADCQARIQLISDGVVASYIHDISTRHRAGNRVPARGTSVAGAARSRSA